MSFQLRCLRRPALRLRHNMAIDTDVELVSFSLTLSPNGESDRWDARSGVGGDVTYLKVAGQWRYMPAVMDRHSRRIVCWSLSHRRDAGTDHKALRQSARNRSTGPGVLFHSDRGIEYAALLLPDRRRADS
jgi:transposase InsO family protein